MQGRKGGLVLFEKSQMTIDKLSCKYIRTVYAVSYLPMSTVALVPSECNNNAIVVWVFSCLASKGGKISKGILILFSVNFLGYAAAGNFPFDHLLGITILLMLHYWTISVSSHQTIIKHTAVIIQSSDSHQAVIRQSSGSNSSYQAVVAQTF